MLRVKLNSKKKYSAREVAELIDENDYIQNQEKRFYELEDKMYRLSNKVDELEYEIKKINSSKKGPKTPLYENTPH